MLVPTQLSSLFRRLLPDWVSQALEAHTFTSTCMYDFCCFLASVQHPKVATKIQSFACLLWFCHCIKSFIRPVLPSVRPSVRPSVLLSNHPPVRLCVRPSFRPSVRLCRQQSSASALIQNTLPPQPYIATRSLPSYYSLIAGTIQFISPKSQCAEREI